MKISNVALCAVVVLAACSSESAPTESPAAPSNVEAPVEGAAEALVEVTTPGVRAQALPVAHEPVGAEILLNTHWYQDSNFSAPREFIFTEGLLTIVLPTGEFVGFAADYTAQHPICVGHPLCVVVVESDNSLAAYHFGVVGEQMYQAECISALNMEAAPAQELRRTVRDERGDAVLWDRLPAICWKQPDLAYEQVPMLFAVPTPAADGSGDGAPEE